MSELIARIKALLRQPRRRVLGNPREEGISKPRHDSGGKLPIRRKAGAVFVPPGAPILEQIDAAFG